MSITSANFVISQFETEKLRYFIIFDEDNDPIFVQNELIDQESAIAKLRNFFRDNNGYFSIKVFGSKLSNPKNKAEQDKKIVAKYNVELTHKLDMGNINNAVQMNGFGMSGFGGPLAPDDPRQGAPNIFGLVNEMGAMATNLKLMEKDHAHYRELKDLQDRLEKAEKERETSTGMNGVLSTLGENFKDPAVLMGLLSGLGGLFKGAPAPAVMPMTGVDSAVESNVDLRKQAMVNSVNTLMQLDSEFVENISALASLAQNKPDTYKMAVQYLKTI